MQCEDALDGDEDEPIPLFEEHSGTDLAPEQEPDSDAHHAQIAAYLRGLSSTEQHDESQMHVEHEPHDEPVSSEEDSQMLCDSLGEWTRIFHEPA